MGFFTLLCSFKSCFSNAWAPLAQNRNGSVRTKANTNSRKKKSGIVFQLWYKQCPTCLLSVCMVWFPQNLQTFLFGSVLNKNKTIPSKERKKKLEK